MSIDPSRLGLCATCRHARRVPTPRATYLLCGLAAADPSYEKYPRLPVVQCDGYEPGAGGAAAGPFRQR